MNKQIFDDETVMAFADGETDAETTSRIEAALETDDELMARVAMFMETRAASKSALAPMLDEPVPDHLLASVQRMVATHKANTYDSRDVPGSSPLVEPGENVVTFTPRPAPSPKRRTQSWFAPLAASILAAMIAGGGGYFAGRSTIDEVADMSLPVAPALAGILETAGSGGEPIAIEGATVSVISSFRSEAGEVCREFEVKQRSGRNITSVACHLSDHWETRLALSTAAEASGYVPAAAQDTVDAYLGSIGAASPLSPEEEAAALKVLRESRE